MATRSLRAFTCFLLLFLVFGCLSEPKPKEPVVLDVQPIIDYYPLGGFTGAAEEAVYVIPGDAVTVKSTLKEIVVDKQPPRTTFSKDDPLNIVVFRGIFSTGGYDVRISKVLFDGTTFVVYATFSDPGAGMMVTQAFTQPTAIIPLGKLEKGSYQVKLLVTKEVVTREGVEKGGEEVREGPSFTVEVS